MAVAAVSLLLVTTGCSKVAEKASEKVTEKAIESAAGDGVDVDLDGDGNVAIETEDGSYRAQSGKIPEAWPGEIPMPPGLILVLTGSEVASAEESVKTVSVSATSSKSAAEIKDFYVDAMSGWTETMNSTSSDEGGDFSQLLYEKDGRSVMVIAASDDEETQVSLTHTGPAAP